MARLPYLDPADLAPGDQDLLARPINLHRLLVHSPGAARAFSTLGRYIRHGSPLDPRLRELAILQVGWLARSPYEWSHHIKIGLGFGVTEDDVRALIAESGGQDTALDPAARAVLRAARQIATDGAVSDALFAELRAHLDEACTIDLIVTLGFYAGVVRVLAALRVDVEEEYLPYLGAFPLPDDPLPDNGRG